jgi:glucosyl-3-phosphoglycerate phosphatase
MSRYFIARHGETVFNAAGRMQGEAPHTPLTRAGFAQAEEMGRVLREHLGPAPRLTLWASPTDRALQTLAIVAEHLALDWHAARTDPRLAEMHMGEWGGLYHRDIRASLGPSVDASTWLFSIAPPGGERFDEVAARVGAWLDEQASEEGDRLVIMHGVSSRVLRGVMTGAPHRPECRAPVAASLPQGSIVCIEEGVERVVHLGTGGRGAAAAALSA